MRDRPRARTEGVVSERIDDEVVVYDQLSQTAHCLSSDAASVWEHCDGRKSPAQIARGLKRAPAEVERALDALRECGLLDEAPVGDRGYSRREAAVRAAKVGGAAFAAPLVYSAAVGSVAAALSPTRLPTCGTLPNGCTGFPTGSALPGSRVGSCSGLSLNCGQFTSAGCCYGICYAQSVGNFFCSTQFNCKGALGNSATCPGPGTNTCGTGLLGASSPCCRVNGVLVACSTTTGPNYGCCGGFCQSGTCVNCPSPSACPTG